MKKMSTVLTTGIAMAAGITAASLIPTDKIDKVSASTDFDYTVSTSVLNVRDQASTKGKIVGKVKSGTKLHVLEQMGNGWYKIKFNGVTAYVSGDYVSKSPITTTTPDVKPTETTSYTYTVTASSLNVRSVASTSGRVIGSVKKGQNVSVQQELSNGWYRISYNGRTGYVSGDYVEKKGNVVTQPPTNEVPPVLQGTTFEVFNGDINLRNEASWSGKVLSVIKQGTQVSGEKHNNDWYKVTHNGMTGYVPASYLKSVTVTNPTPPPTEVIPPVTNGTTYRVVNGDINLRSSASWSGPVLTVIKQGAEVQGESYNKDWTKVTYNGQTGYVPASYLQDATEPPVVEVASYTDIDLRKAANITASDIDSYIASYVSLTGKSSKLSGRGQEVINVARQYGINELFFAALMVHESAHGTSYLAHYKNNLTGLYAFDNSAYDSAVRFTSVEESMDYAAKYIRVNYLNEGARYNNGPTLKGMNVKYSSDSAWHTKIAAHMEKMKGFDKGHYDRQAVGAATVNVSLAIPNYSDVFPNFSKAVATAQIALNGGPTLQVGEEFTVLEKNNNFQLKVQTSSGGVYWTKKLPMSNHATMFKIQNLLRVRNNNLQGVTLHTEPNSGSAVASTVENFACLEAALDENKQRITNNGFYAIIFNGQTVWIKASLADVVYG